MLNAVREERTVRESRDRVVECLVCELILERIPAPEYDEGAPFQAIVTNLDASPYLGRLALCRVRNGRVTKASYLPPPKP